MAAFPVLVRADSTNMASLLVAALLAAAVVVGSRLGRALWPRPPFPRSLPVPGETPVPWGALVGGALAAIALAAALVGVSVYNAHQLQQGQLPLTARWQAQVAGKPIKLTYITWQPDVALRLGLQDGRYLLIDDVPRAVTVRPAGRAGSVFSIPRSTIRTVQPGDS
jgi:hypothetical protein